MVSHMWYQRGVDRDTWLFVAGKSRWVVVVDGIGVIMCSIEFSS